MAAFLRILGMGLWLTRSTVKLMWWILKILVIGLLLVLSLLTTNAYVTGSYYMSQDIEKDAQNALNAARQMAGSGLLKAEPRLTAAARWQAEYMSEKDEVKHVRVKDKGLLSLMETPDDRRIMAMYHGGGSEVLALQIGDDPLGPTRRLLNAPYHRVSMLDPNVTEFGSGTVLTNKKGFPVTYGAFELGGYRSDKTSSVIVWPTNGAVNIPSSFRPASEDPSPAPGKANVGYILSVQVGHGNSLTPKSFTLVHAKTGTIISGEVRSSANDKELSAGAVLFIPDKPLLEGEKYEAHFTGAANFGLIDKSWAFTTQFPKKYSITRSKALVKLGEPAQFLLEGPATKFICTRTSPKAKASIVWLDSEHINVTIDRCENPICAVQVMLAKSRGCAVPIVISGILLDKHH